MLLWKKVFLRVTYQHRHRNDYKNYKYYKIIQEELASPRAATVYSQVGYHLCVNRLPFMRESVTIYA